VKNVFIAIFVAFIVLVVSFVGIGGSFERQFWLAFLPGLMENLAALAVAVFVIERIFRSERVDKLKQTNERQSRFVEFLVNRLAFRILKHLALATDQDMQNDSKMNFDFAFVMFQKADVPTIFYEKFMASETKEDFAGGFSRILAEGTETISKALDAVYPRPDPGLKQNDEQMNFAAGSLEALKALISAFGAANAEVKAGEQMKPEHLDLLIKMMYGSVRLQLLTIQRLIIHIRDKAQANELFFALD
jgi:hypothetical protein